MHRILLNKRSYNIPSHWKEVTPNQLTGVAPYLLGTEDSFPFRKLMVLFVLIPQLKPYWYRTNAQEWITEKLPWTKNAFPSLTLSQKWDLLPLCEWFFNDISGRSILREFQHQGIKYLLPEDNLIKESILSYAFADNYFNEFVSTGDHKYLLLMIACVARQERTGNYKDDPAWEGDNRELFSTERTNDRAASFVTLDTRIVNTILLYFMGSKKYIHEQYAVIFNKPEKKAESVEARKASFGQKKIPKPDFGWLGIIYELAEMGTFGNFDSVKHMFLHTCCYYLAKKRYDVEELKK